MPDAHLHCTKRSAVHVSPLQNTGIASAAPRNDRGGRHRTPLLARRGRSVHGLTSPSPRVDLPLQNTGIATAQNAAVAPTKYRDCGSVIEK